MSLSIGIIGLPNAGKSTFFNALVKKYQANVDSYPFTTIDPNVGVVEVPDQRLNKLAAILKLPKKLPATIEFVDIAGLVKDAHKGAGLGNQFLSHVRAVNAIVHIVRGFPDAADGHAADPAADYQTIRKELEFADQDK
ncbi:50S ribosome-binding GTPase, partial [Candidatus Microgenomates bacterium]|nr:50S ribosome-binding GTPase [Candidatus Microgenomates bacterium]